MDTIYAAGCGVGCGQAVEGRNVNSEFCNARQKFFGQVEDMGAAAARVTQPTVGYSLDQCCPRSSYRTQKLMQRAGHPTIVRPEVVYKHISTVKIRHALPALLMPSIYRRMHPFRTYYRQKIS